MYKNRTSLIRVVFRAYLNLKTVNSISEEMLARRAILQDIGRDNLKTKELVAFIDWRNIKMEEIENYKNNLVDIYLNEILNLNHLFVYTIQKNQD